MAVACTHCKKEEEERMEEEEEEEERVEAIQDVKCLRVVVE